ncbi:MAG: hypothetical protein ACHBN1_19255 [Heteroscytonema crispum UTEX LB 1556]
MLRQKRNAIAYTQLHHLTLLDYRTNSIYFDCDRAIAVVQDYNQFAGTLS